MGEQKFLQAQKSGDSTTTLFFPTTVSIAAFDFEASELNHLNEQDVLFFTVFITLVFAHLTIQAYAYFRKKFTSIQKIKFRREKFNGI